MDTSYCGHLTEAMTQMGAKNLQRFKISLLDLRLAHCIEWSSKCTSPAKPLKPLLVGKKLPNAESHSLDEKIYRTVLHVRESNLLIDQETPYLLQGSQRLIDTVVAAL